SFKTTDEPEGMSLQSNNCAAATLTSGANCTFQILIRGSNQPSSFVLSPKVCAYNGAVCSQPVLTNRLQVTVAGNIIPDFTMAYVTNVNSATVSLCPINLDGTFGSCADSSAGAAFTQP